MSRSYSLCHYGVKGMKWGVRRYQDYDGALTRIGRNRKTMSSVNSIVDSMSKKDLHFLYLSPDGPSDTYQTVDEGQFIAKRIIKKIGDVPVSFFDAWESGNDVQVAIGTRSGEEYRNKGYAKSVALKGKKWLDDNVNKYDNIYWYVDKKNFPSRKIAESIGFKLDESSVLPQYRGVAYKYRK